MSFRSPAGISPDALPKRTWWTCEVIKSTYGSMEERRSVEDEKDALLVASLTENGLHAPALDFDFPVETRQRDGVTRLRFPGLILRPRPWRKLLAHLAKVGFIPADFTRHQDAQVDPEETELYLDFIVPVRVFPSSHPGHHHVYIDVEMPWDAYRELCKKMQHARLLEPGYVEISTRDGMTMLIKQGLTKQQLIADGRMLAKK